jgi:hypothetical protein
VLKAESSFLLFKAYMSFVPHLLCTHTLAYDVVQLRKIWSCIRMMVPMLKLHLSSVKFPMVSIVNGTGTEADFISVFVISFAQTYRSWL